MTGHAPTKQDRWVALGLFAFAFTLMLATQRAVGYVRDESVYFEAAERAAGWFRLLFQNPVLAFSDNAIVSSFDFNHEHPVLMKSLFGLSFLLFHEGLNLLSPAAAFRLPAFAFGAVIPAVLYLFGVRVYGRTAGVFAALSFLLVPRQFFNSQLSCFDVPVATMWLVTVYLFWRALEERRAWLWCGIAFGLAIATKHNALFLPFVLTPFGLYRAWQGMARQPEVKPHVVRFVALFAGVAVGYLLLFVALESVRTGEFQRRFELLSPHSVLFLLLAVGSAALLWRLREVSEETFRPLAALAAMAVLGPVIFYAHWPYLWHHPVDRTAWYLAFHAMHHHYAWFYLGTLLRQPPFPLEYVLVKTALTVPTSLFVPMALGLFAVLGRAVAGLFAKTKGWVRPVPLVEALIAVNAVTSILIISHPQVPHFGGVKHWFPSMLFLSLLAGACVARAEGWMRERFGARLPTRAGLLVPVALCALIFTPALIASIRIHPYGTSYYSELAGGLPGAATLGMQRQFWSNNVTGVLPWINEHAPQGARVYLHEVNGFSFRDYQRNGLLRRDLQGAGGPQDSQIAAYQYHQEFREHEFNIWQAYGTTRPATGLYVDETPQVIVYQRP